MVGLLILLAGCRVRDRVHESNDRVAHGGYHNTPAPGPGKMAAVGNDSITTECEHETYANASKGLIVGEARLHEDVFAMRDRASLAVIYSYGDFSRGLNVIVLCTFPNFSPSALQNVAGS